MVAMLYRPQCDKSFSINRQMDKRKRDEPKLEFWIMAERWDDCTYLNMIPLLSVNYNLSYWTDSCLWHLFRSKTRVSDQRHVLLQSKCHKHNLIMIIMIHSKSLLQASKAHGDIYKGSHIQIHSIYNDNKELQKKEEKSSCGKYPRNACNVQLLTAFNTTIKSIRLYIK